MTYTVWDAQKSIPANRRVYETRKGAQRTADKLNLGYGAHRYSVKTL